MMMPKYVRTIYYIRYQPTVKQPWLLYIIYILYMGTIYKISILNGVDYEFLIFISNYS